MSIYLVHRDFDRKHFNFHKIFDWNQDQSTVFQETTDSMIKVFRFFIKKYIFFCLSIRMY